MPIKFLRGAGGLVLREADVQEWYKGEAWGRLAAEAQLPKDEDDAVSDDGATVIMLPNLPGKLSYLWNYCSSEQTPDLTLTCFSVEYDWSEPESGKPESAIFVMIQLDKELVQQDEKGAEVETWLRKYGYTGGAAWAVTGITSRLKVYLMRVRDPFDVT